jgi:hypothetical protein
MIKEGWAQRQTMLRIAKRKQEGAETVVDKKHAPPPEVVVEGDFKKESWASRQIRKHASTPVEEPPKVVRKKRVKRSPPASSPAPTPLRTRDAHVPVPPWTEKYRPQSVAQVVGHAKAKLELQQWVQVEKCFKPLLLCGPTGVGKTSLAHALLQDHGFLPKDCRNLHGDFLGIAEQLMFRAGDEKIGIIVDEVDNVDAHDRAKLVALLKDRRDGVPIICTAENPFDKHIESVKNVCKVVRLYKPLNVGADVRTLLARLVHAEGLKPAAVTLTTIEAVSNGDMRRATALLELSTRGALTQRGLYTADVFLDSPFDAASSLMRGTPRQFSSVEQAAEVCHADADMVLLLVQENYVKEEGVTLEKALSQALILSDVDMLDSHPMHQTHGTAETLLVAAAMAAGSSRRGQKRLDFTSYLGNLASRKAFRSAVKPVESMTRTLGGGAHGYMTEIPVGGDPQLIQWLAGGLGMSAKEVKDVKKVMCDKRLQYKPS